MIERTNQNFVTVVGYGGRLSTLGNGGETFYYVLDGNKNVLGLLDSSNARVASYTYGLFGQLLTSEGALAQANPFRFSSEFHDDETGLVYYNYRYYNPALGRWTKRDPIDEGGGMNLYGMCRNNTINMLDRNGLAYRLGNEPKPSIKWDKGFKFDPNAKPTWRNKMSYLKYLSLLNGAEALGHLPDGTRAYRHYLSGLGTDLSINYLKFYNEDTTGKTYLDNDLKLAMLSVEDLHIKIKVNKFSISVDDFFVDSSTENWLKAIGGHRAWGRGAVEFKWKNCEYTLFLTFYMEDFYNFNKGQFDVHTGLPDDENGAFAVLGWAKPFYSRGNFNVAVSWKRGSLSDAEIDVFDGNRNIRNRRNRNSPRDRNRRSR